MAALVKQRCRYCKRMFRCTPQGYAENPWCGGCLHERLAKAAAEAGPVEWVHLGNGYTMPMRAGKEGSA